MHSIYTWYPGWELELSICLIGGMSLFLSDSTFLTTTNILIPKLEYITNIYKIPII